MTPEVADLVGRYLASERYEVLAKLGEGGMGFVYKARDHNLDCNVVIKIPRPAMLQNAEFKVRFMRELRSLVKLSAPHIVKIIDIGEQQGVPFAVMEYLSGGSLENRQRRGPDGRAAPLPSEHLLDWLEPVAQALDFIHAQGYVHRDIKPANILFDAHGHPYVGDFGVAKVMHAGEDLKRTNVQTQDGMVLGTAHYMAPEMIMGQKFDGRVDQYALAATVYEMVAGRVPISGPNPHAIMVKQATHKPAPLCELGPSIQQSLSDAVDRGLAKNPRQRFPDCVSFARAALKGLKPLAPKTQGTVKERTVNPSPNPRTKPVPQEGGAETGRVEQARMDTKGTLTNRSSSDSGPKGMLLKPQGSHQKNRLVGLLIVGAVLALLSAGTIAGVWFLNRPTQQAAVHPPSTPLAPTQQAAVHPPSTSHAPTQRSSPAVPPLVPRRLGLAAIDDVSLEAGGVGRSIRLKIERQNCAGEPIELEIFGLPPRVSAANQTLLGDRDEAIIELKADSAAERTTGHKAKVVARCSRLNLMAEREFLVSVSVPAKPPALTASLKISPLGPVSLAAGGASQSLRIQVERRNCAGEPVQLEIIGLPKSLTPPASMILGNTDSVSVVMKAVLTEKAGTSKGKVVARVSKGNLKDEQDLLVTVRPLEVKLRTDPSTLFIEEGDNKSLTVTVTARDGYEGPLQIQAGSVATPLVRVKARSTAAIPAGENSAQLQLLAVATGEEEVLIYARIGDKEVVGKPAQIKVIVTSPGKAFKLAESYLKEGKFAEAIKAYDTVLKTDPKRRFDALVGRAEALAVTGSYEKARSNLKNAQNHEKGKGHPLPIALLGYVEFKEKNDKDFARKMAEDALRCKDGMQCGWAWYVGYLACEALNIQGPLGDASYYKKMAYEFEPRLKNLQGK